MVAVHVEVVNECKEAETAWAEGPGFPGANWAMYVEYELNCCEDDAGSGDADVDGDVDGDADTDVDVIK